MKPEKRPAVHTGRSTSVDRPQSLRRKDAFRLEEFPSLDRLSVRSRDLNSALKTIEELGGRFTKAQEAFAQTQLRLQQLDSRLAHIEQQHQSQDSADELRKKILTLVDYASFYNSKEDFIQALRFAVQENPRKLAAAKAAATEYFDDTRPEVEVQASLHKPSSAGEDTFLALQIERDNLRHPPKASNFGPTSNLSGEPVTGQAAGKKVNLREEFTSERRIPYLDALGSSKLLRAPPSQDVCLFQDAPDDRFIRIELRKMPSGKRHSLPHDNSPLDLAGGLKYEQKRKPSIGPDHKDFFEDAHLQTSELNHSEHSPRDSMKELVFKQDRYQKNPTKRTAREAVDSSGWQDSGGRGKLRPEITVTMKQSDSSSLDDDNDSSPQPKNISFFIEKV